MVQRHDLPGRDLGWQKEVDLPQTHPPAASALFAAETRPSPAAVAVNGRFIRAMVDATDAGIIAARDRALILA